MLRVNLNYFTLKDSISALIWGSLFSCILKNRPKGLRVVRPRKFVGISRMVFGNNVYFASNCWVQAHSASSVLRIGENSCIGNNCHIYSLESIIIGKNVLIADNVYLSDNLHAFKNISVPILKQEIIHNGNLEIGSGSWIGENVCVLGSSIGKNTVIGANSVVTKDIPDYCVAVGAPAKIIKRYCLVKNKWLSTDANGEFI